MNSYSVIISPVLSEKSTLVRENSGKYTFLVHREATKADVKSAVEKLFNVKVEKVNTSLTRGKERRRGQFLSLSPKKKKAMVTLAEGQKLDIFEDH